ncbi:MAG: single-stranded-DNA-specific exonuclease RecJ [Bdellovibrionota bacterium]
MNWKSRLDQNIPPEPPIPMPEPLWNSLFARGFQTKEAVDNLFSPSLQNISDPFLILNMDIACERLLKAFINQEKVTIYADFDLDGTSGLALLYDGLTQLGFKNLTYFQPKRLSEGYGLHEHIIEELAATGTQVVVTVDVGITALDAAKKAKECGIDLIITDHHLPYEELPDAYTIVNPNQKACTSGLGYLCGAGVGFYLLMAIKKILSQNGLGNSNFNLKDVLDFFVIGTLTDLVPLVKDNRVLVKHGLARLSKTERPALKSLIHSLSLNDRLLTSQEVAINLAPKLNALSRMEAEILPRDVLLETNADKASAIVENVLKTQEDRKKYQKSAYLKALELQETMDQKGYVWVWSHEFHKGVIGLVATALSELLRVPAFVGSINEKGEISGSSRLPDGMEYDLTQVLDNCKLALSKYGGHAQAAGFGLSAENALKFDELLKEYFDKNNKPSTAKVIVYDSVAKFRDLTPQFMKWCEGLEPYGKDFPALTFKFEGVRVVNIRNMNGGHLRFTLEQEGKTFLAVVFSPSELYRNLVDNDVIDIIAEARWNYFRGDKTLQLNLKDVSCT